MPGNGGYGIFPPYLFHPTLTSERNPTIHMVTVVTRIPTLVPGPVLPAPWHVDMLTVPLDPDIVPVSVVWIVGARMAAVDPDGGE